MPFASSNGCQIHYRVEGNGPPLVLHPGYLGQNEDWYRLGYVEALQAFYRLILLDPRGQGASAGSNDPADYTLPTRVADVVAVLDDQDIKRAAFLGYSMGGEIGFAAGLFAPERFTALIIGGAHPYFGEPIYILAPIEEEAVLLQSGMDRWVQEYERLYGPLSEAVRAQWLASNGPALAAHVLAYGKTSSLADRLASITLPTLVYCGTEDDDAGFERARHAALAIPNATFVPLEGLGHIGAFRESTTVVPHIRTFLERLPTNGDAWA
jgi:pimeloyl-ACP methyl ester carboxylesterase